MYRIRMTSETWKNPCLAKQHNGQEKSAASVAGCCFLSVRHLVSFLCCFLTGRNQNALTVRHGIYNWTNSVTQFSLPHRWTYWQFLYHSTRTVWAQSKWDKQRSQLAKYIQTMPTANLFWTIEKCTKWSYCWRRQAFIIHRHDKEVSLQYQS